MKFLKKIKELAISLVAKLGFFKKKLSWPEEMAKRMGARIVPEDEVSPQHKAFGFIWRRRL